MMKIIMKSLNLIFLTIIFISIIGCATILTKEGKFVKLFVKQEAPSNAEFLGDIETSFLGEPSVKGVKNYLRNKTAKMGGNLVVIDFIDVTYNRNDGTKMYSGDGRAYRVK